LSLDLYALGVTLNLLFLFPTDASGKTFVAGLAARGKTSVAGAEAAAVSFPEFWDELGGATDSS
jgi:hypothetical protein